MVIDKPCLVSNANKAHISASNSELAWNSAAEIANLKPGKHLLILSVNLISMLDRVRETSCPARDIFA